jgi:hypothetical protein
VPIKELIHVRRPRRLCDVHRRTPPDDEESHEYHRRQRRVLMRSARVRRAQDPVLRVIASSAGPLVDPEAPYWKDAPLNEMLRRSSPTSEPDLVSRSLYAVHNGGSPSYGVGMTDQERSPPIVCDQVVEMPAATPGGQPNPMMGNRERIHYATRAAFTRHGEVASRISDSTPSSMSVYRQVAGTDARAYTGAVGVDNPISRPKHSAVLDQMAEGFGTLTVEPEQQSDGRGVWADGRWHVVITHPMAPGDPNDPTLAPGSETLAAFAVWEGGARDVGARKAWSNWVQLKLEASPQ